MLILTALLLSNWPEGLSGLWTDHWCKWQLACVFTLSLLCCWFLWSLFKHLPEGLRLSSCCSPPLLLAFSIQRPQFPHFHLSELWLLNYKGFLAFYTLFVLVVKFLIGSCLSPRFPRKPGEGTLCRRDSLLCIVSCRETDQERKQSI